ncbi:MAG: UbiD family decarboxylase, partial [Bacteroidales bacterium]|nr:UbiD family decarboxylase [Bacteroidales bacterium]
AVFPATIVGIPPQEDNWIGKATERLFLMPMKTTLVPELADISMPKEGVFHNVAVVSIRKTYPGQAMKVMNALWGAGQMMFNKILVVVDQGVDVHDPRAVMQAVSEHVFPSRDLHSSRGPLDVLDHASAVAALGGKLGIDATAKHSEEALQTELNEEFEGSISLEKVKAADEDITGVWSGESLGYPLLVVALKKTSRRQVRKLADKLEGAGRLLPFRFLVVTEHLVDPSDLSDVLWRVTGNLDVSRDCFVLSDQDPRGVLVVDGTRKYHRLDGFTRPWPNIIAMDEATINQVDQRWEQYRLGPFIPSPSLKYLDRKYPGQAVAEEGWSGEIRVLDLDDEDE